MSNAVAVDTSSRLHRAARLDDLFTDERWSSREIAAKTGLVHTYVQRRRNGASAISLEDLDVFAPLVRMSPVELHVYLNDTKPRKLVP